MTESDNRQVVPFREDQHTGSSAVIARCRRRAASVRIALLLQGDAALVALAGGRRS